MGIWVFRKPSEYNQDEGYYAPCWERRHESGSIFTIVRETFLSSRVWIIVSNATITR
jgi:hypothetical protein